MPVKPRKQLTIELSAKEGRKTSRTSAMGCLQRVLERGVR